MPVTTQNVMLGNSSAHHPRCDFLPRKEEFFLELKKNEYHQTPSAVQKTGRWESEGGQEQASVALTLISRLLCSGEARPDQLHTGCKTQWEDILPGTAPPPLVHLPPHDSSL